MAAAGGGGSADAARKVLMGTCGWSDESIQRCGRFYPASVRSAEARLRHYSTHFPCSPLGPLPDPTLAFTFADLLAFKAEASVGVRFGVKPAVSARVRVEVDTSTYAIPGRAAVSRWLQCVPRGFVFHFKAFGLLCSQSCPLNSVPRGVREKLPPSQGNRVTLKSLPPPLRDEIWARFNGAVGIAHAANALGCIVFQFHLGFRPTKESRAHVEWCRQHLDSRFEMAAEFRCREWVTSCMTETCEFLQSLSITLIAADELKHETFQRDRDQTGLPPGQVPEVLPVAWAVTQPKSIYVRVHRREGTSRVLSKDELATWQRRLSNLPKALKGPVYFMWGTDHEDQPIINAKNLAILLGPQVAYNWQSALRSRHTSGSLLSLFSADLNSPPAKKPSSTPRSPVEECRCEVPEASAEAVEMCSDSNSRKRPLDGVPVCLVAGEALAQDGDCLSHETPTKVVNMPSKNMDTVASMLRVQEDGLDRSDLPQKKVRAMQARSITSFFQRA
eukprot:SM000107S14047  [mRNA]  locus=s107:141773:144739:- [translate_table: standard]